MQGACLGGAAEGCEERGGDRGQPSPGGGLQPPQCGCRDFIEELTFFNYNFFLTDFFNYNFFLTDFFNYNFF